MDKHRINTTISAKHWEILKKHTSEFETQQKALEAALESLEKNSNQNPDLSPEEQLWMRMGKELRQSIIVTHKEILKALMQTADFEQLLKVAIKLNLMDHMVAFSCRNPPNECSLKEIMDGVVLGYRIANFFDSIYYTDYGSYYLLEAIHSIGTENTNFSRTFKLFFQDFFKKHGVKNECKISENSVFIKIYKT